MRERKSGREPLAKHFYFPAAHDPFAIELRADIVLLNPVMVDDAQMLKALPSQIVRKLRAERTGAAQRHLLQGKPGEAVRAEIEGSRGMVVEVALPVTDVIR